MRYAISCAHPLVVHDQSRVRYICRHNRCKKYERDSKKHEWEAE